MKPHVLGWMLLGVVLVAWGFPRGGECAGAQAYYVAKNGSDANPGTQAAPWMGVPGKFRKKLGGEDQETILRYAKNYLDYKEQYLRERRST